jgi:hypothetical protein
MRVALASAVSLALVVVALPALADDEPPLPRPRPTAPDTRAGKPTLALSVGFQKLWNDAEQGVSRSNIAALGTAPGLSLAYPFRRDFAVEAWGTLANFGAADGCIGCKASSVAAGLGAVYHLVDGIPLDPWFSVGVGFRQTKLTAPALLGASTVTYQGIEAMRLSMGSDYYPTPVFGFGPLLDLGFGRDLTRSPGTIGGGTLHLSLTAGFRVVVSPFQ